MQQYSGRRSGAADAKGDAEWTGQDIAECRGWRWKSRQPGDAVRRQAEDGTMVGGGVEDRSGGGRRVARRKTHRKAEDASGAEVESEMEGIRGFPLQVRYRLDRCGGRRVMVLNITCKEMQNGTRDAKCSLATQQLHFRWNLLEI